MSDVPTRIIKAAFLEARPNRFGGATIRYYTEASEQTFKKGDFVRLYAGNIRVAVPTDDKVLGMAMQDATGVGGTLIPVAVFDENTRVVLNYYDSSESKGWPTSINDIGTRKVLRRLAPGIWVADRDGTANILVVEGFYPGDPIGTIGGRYVCKIIPSALETCVDST